MIVDAFEHKTFIPSVTLGPINTKSDDGPKTYKK